MLKRLRLTTLLIIGFVIIIPISRLRSHISFINCHQNNVWVSQKEECQKIVDALNDSEAEPNFEKSYECQNHKSWFSFDLTHVHEVDQCWLNLILLALLLFCILVIIFVQALLILQLYWLNANGEEATNRWYLYGQGETARILWNLPIDHQKEDQLW